MSNALLEIRQKSQDVKGRESNTVHEDLDVKNDNRHPSHFSVHCVEKIWIIVNFI